MISRVAHAAAIAIVAVAACGGATPAGSGEPDPRSLLLRLSDLPRGYRVGDDSGCGVGTEGAPREVADVIREYRPAGCIVQLERVWPPARGQPTLVESAALVFDGEAGAQTGFRAAAGFARHTFALGRDLQQRPPGVTIGNETLHLGGSSGEAVVWRSRRLLALVFVKGTRVTALRLARRQQARIENPEPPPPQRESDAEVVFDHPRLGIEVWWLGRSFSPGRKLPPLKLADAAGPLAPGGGPGNVLKIDYAPAVRAGGITLDIWRRAAWQRFTKTPLGRLVWSSPCARVRRIALARGYALLYGGYGTSECPQRPFDRFLAHAYVGDVVVAVNMPYCFSCAARLGSPDPYNSWRGMEAIVRGLRLRKA